MIKIRCPLCGNEAVPKIISDIDKTEIILVCSKCGLELVKVLRDTEIRYKC